MATKSNSQRAIEARKKRQDEENKKSSSSSNTLRNSDIAKKLSYERTINFDTLETDLKTTAKTIESVYNGWQTRETMENALSSVQSIYDRIGKYQEYQQKYGGADLTEVHNSYKSVLDGWKDLSKTYAPYKSADEYNTAIKSAKEKAAEYESMKTADLGNVQTEITDLEDILKTVNEHESNIQGLRNRQSTWQSRSRGASDDGGYNKQIQAAEAELNKYLKSVGYEDTNALKKALGEKKTYKNRAEWVQKGREMASVGDKSSKNYDKDFAQKSKYVPKDKTAFSFDFGVDDDLIYDYINDAEDTRKNYQENVESSADASVLMAGYEHMTDEEVSTYNYYYNTVGAKKAREYLDTIAENLGARKAVADFERYEGKAGKELLQGIGAGFDQFASGMKNLFNFTDEYIPTNSVQQLSGLVREDLTYEHGTLGQVGYDLIKTTSNMLPSILTSAVVGTVNPTMGANVGAGLMGASASGNAYQEMLNLGYDKGQARTYSALVGASEATLQRVMGGIGKLGGVSGKLSKLVSGIDNGLAKFAIRWGGSVLSEGLEEATQEVLAPLFTNLAAGYDTGADVDWSEVVYSGLLGALSGGLLEGSGIATNSIQESSQNKRLGQAIKANERTGEMFGLIDGLTPEESEAYAAYTRYANKGITADNISNTQLGNLHSLATSDAMKTMQSKTATEEQKTSAENTLRDLAAYVQKSPASQMTAEDVDEESLKEMLTQALTLDENTEGYKLATQYQAKLDKGKKLSTKEIRKLVAATDAVYDTEAQSDVEAQLTELGETGDVTKIADAIMKEQSGKILTTEERNIIKNSKYGEYVADGLTSEEIVEAEEALGNSARVMSEEESKLFNELYDGTVDIEDYRTSFNLVAQYAQDSFTQDTILKNKGVLTTDQVGKIYSATVLAKRKARENKISKIHEKMGKGMSYKGIIDDTIIDYDNKSTEGKINWSSLKPKQREAITFIKGIAKATGMNLKLTNEGFKTNKYNGIYIAGSNTIVLDIYAGIDKTKTLSDTLIPTFSHELTHWMKDKSPLLYRKLDEFIFNSLFEKDNISEEDRVGAEITKLEKALGIEVTAEEARDEIIARACEDMLSMSEEGKKLFNSLSESEQKTFVDKIKDIIAKLKDWVTELLTTYDSHSYEATLLREYESALNEMSKLWDEMLADAVKNNQALELSGEYEHKKSTTEGDVKFQTRSVNGNQVVWIEENILKENKGQPEHQFIADFIAEHIGEVYTIIESGQKVYIGEDLPGEYTQSKYTQTILKNNKAIIKAKNRVVPNIGEVIEIATNREWSKNGKTNKDAKYGIYKYDTRFGFPVRNSNNEIVGANIYKARLVIRNASDGRKYLYDIVSIKKDIPSSDWLSKKIASTAVKTAAQKNDASADSIPNSDETVNTKFSLRDSNGRELSKGQQDYFKDSKVRDENGNLLVMYQGSSNDFTVFDRQKSKYSNLYGRGFYFTKSESHAKQYGDTRAYYLDIKNPVSTKETTITKAQMLKFLEAVAENEDYGIENYGYGATPESVVESLYGKTDFLMLNDVSQTAIGDLVEAVELFNEVNGTNFDGLILDTETITFRSEQAKLTSNENPTKNKDIRFSLREKVEETKDLIAVHNMQVAELEKSLNLGGLPMPSIAIIKAQNGHSEYGDVSLVFPKSTIDPKVSKLNKVYGGDAWTPTYPTIEYKPNAKVAKKISDKYYELSKKFGYDESRPLYSFVHEIEEQLNRHKGEADLIEELYDNERMMQLYLLDSGKSKIETIQKEVRTELTDAEVEMNEFFIRELGANVIDEIVWDGNGTPMSFRKTYLSKHEDAIREAYKKLLSEEYGFTDEQVQNVLDSTKAKDIIKFMRDAHKYRENGRVTTRTEDDFVATKQAIRVAAGDEYHKWVDSLFKGIEEKSGIRNNADPFTNYGNRRSWEALHWENNLENVVRVMKSQENGQALFGGAGIWGVSAKEYSSISDIKADSSRLTKMSQEEYDAIKENLGERFQEIATSIMDKTEKNQFIAADTARECIVDAVRSSKTKSGILNNLKQHRHLNITETTVDDIVRLVSDIANMPTEYFEAKPKRAVGFDEVATAIIPDNTSAELKTMLADNNINFVEYESGNDTARIDALNSLEDVKFSLRDVESQKVHELMGEAERLKKENEKLNQDFEYLKERLKIERQVTNGNYFNENQLGAVAGHLRNISKSFYPKLDLMKRLKDVYSYIAQTGEYANGDVPTWDVLFNKAYSIAVDMLNDAQPEVMVDDYAQAALRDLRSRRISLSQTQIAEAKYRFGDHYNRMFFGKIIITKDGIPLDDVWPELCELYPTWFSYDTTEGDEIGILYDALEEMKEISEKIVEYNTDERARWLAMEIYNQYWNVSNIKTTADKYDKKIKQLNFDHRNRIQMLREDYNARLKERELELRWLAAKDKHELLKNQDARLKEQREADLAKYQKLADRIRENRDKKIAEAKEQGKERLAQYRENAEKKTRIQRITQNALTLNEWLVKNSKDKHIHESLKGPVVALLNAIDFSSKRLLDKGTPTKKDISLSQALNKVQMMMKDASVGKEELVELYGHGLDDDIEALIASVDSIMRDVGDNEFVLHKMTLTDLKTLDNMVRTIKHSVSKMNKFHVVHHAKGIANLSQESMEYLDSLGKGKVYDGLKGDVKKLLNWNNALPYYAFKRYGSGGMKIYEALQDGWDKFAFNTKAIIDYAEKAYKSKEVKEWSESIKSFRLLLPATEYELNDPDYRPQYQTIQMTIPQIMSLYCLSKRAQGRKHLFQGGIRVADFKDKKGNIVAQTDGVIFTESDIQEIFDSLTDRQKAVADELQKFMNTTCADWGNEVSMLRFGYRAFGEENYFPIQSDPLGRKDDNDDTPKEHVSSLFKLLNMSFTKSTDENANNRVVISDIFDVFAQHTSDMAKYNALALPVLDAYKWYSYVEKEPKGDGTFKTSTLKASMVRAFGEDGQSYFTTFLKDINGQQESDREQLSKIFMRNYKIASVGANLRVIALQPTSYVRASAVIDNKYLVKALGHKPKIQKAETHCGMALWKSMGYYDTNIQKGVEAQIKHNETWKDKAAEWSMMGAGAADKLTWGFLWNACEIEVRETRKDLKVGSKEFNEAIGKRLREIIYATQVVDSTMTRSQLMRSSKMHDQIATNFASEPTLAYNMLQDAYTGYKLDARRMGKKEAIKKNGKRIARTVYAYTMTNAIAALVESGFDAWRDDEDEEKDLAYFMKLYLSNFASDMSITGKIPYIKEIHSLIRGYSLARSELAWMESSYKTISGIYKNLQGDGNPVTTLKNSIKTLSYLSGLPFYSAYRDIMAGLDNFEIFTAEDLDEMFEGFID